MTKILIADDHILFREGLASLIDRWPDFQVVGEASNGIEAIEAARSSRPDVILMDITMPEMDGLEATRLIMHELPETRIIMLTVSEEEEKLFQAMKAGAHGYVIKDTPARRLHDLLRGALRGETPISGIMATKMLNEFSHPQSTGGKSEYEGLTEREQQVLKWVAAGLSNGKIARQLTFSENTIKKDIRSILQKLHLNNRLEAAVYAVQKGWAAPEIVRQPPNAAS